MAGLVIKAGGDTLTNDHHNLPLRVQFQYDVSLQYTGYGSPGDQLVLRGSIAERRFTGFLLEDGRVVAAITIGKPDPALDVEALIRSRAVVDPTVLADETASIEAPA